MALYSAMRLAQMRQDMASLGTVTFVKADVNVAVQSIEDLMLGAGKTALFNAIESAAPGVFTNAQKGRLFRVWVIRRFGQDRGN